MRRLPKSASAILHSLPFWWCIWTSQLLVAAEVTLFNDDVLPATSHPGHHHHPHQNQHLHQHSVTDGLDVVTWTMTSLKNGGRANSLDGYVLTCNMSSAASAPKGKHVLSDQDTVKQHRQMCDHHSRQKRGVVAPGTKWCGSGNDASNRNDLGWFRATDRCCRSHDFCPLAIEGRKKKYGLYNSGLFTKSSCVCDDAFRKCLQSAGTTAANLVGTIFFNILQAQCLDFGGPSRVFATGTPVVRDNPPFKIKTTMINDAIDSVKRFLGRLTS